MAIEEVIRLRDEASGALRKLERVADDAAQEMADLDAEARAAAKGLATTGTAAKSSTASIGKMAAAHVAGALSVSALTSAVQVVGRAMLDSALFASDFADRMIILARQTGLAEESVVGLSYAAQAGGGDVSQLRTGLTAFLAVAQQAATGSDTMAERLARVGVVATDATGSLRSMDELLRETLQGIAALPSETERAAAAVELFGARGGALVAVLGDGTASLDEWTRRAKEAGVVVDRDLAAASATADEALASLRLQLDGIKLAVGQEVIPLIKALADAFQLAAPIIRFVVEDVVEDLRRVTTIIDGVIYAVQQVGEAFKNIPKGGGLRDYLRAFREVDQALGDTLRGFVARGGTPAGAGGDAGAAAGLAVPELVPAIAATTDAVDDLAREIDANLRLVHRAIEANGRENQRANDRAERDRERALREQTKANEKALQAAVAPSAGPTGVETATAALGAIQGGLTGILSALGPEGALAAAIVQVVSNPAEMLSGIVAEVDQLLEGLLVELVPALLEAIPALVDSLLVKLPELIPGFVQALVTLIPKLISAILQAVPAIVAGLVEAFPALVMALIEGFVENLRTLFVELPVAFAKAIGQAIANLFKFGKKKKDEAPSEPVEMSFASGGRVDRTGLALVHRGERIVPPSGVGSQATERARMTSGGGGGPVTINISGVIASDVDAFVRQLRRHLRGRNLDLGVA